MMLLAIDVGNTNMVFSLFRRDEEAGSFRLMTDLNRTSDEIGLAVCDFFRRFGFHEEELSGVIIASVVPPVMHSLTNAVYKYLGQTPVIVGEDVDCGLTYGMASDERLGADRAVACAAAIEKYGAPLVVLDFGTATTIDAINARGEYVGGCILAGVRIATEALFGNAALLPRVELARPDKIIGTTTVGQIQAGAVCGYIGSIEYLVRETKREMGAGAVQVVATGGMARMVAEGSDVIDIMDHQLIPYGLKMIYKRWRAGQET